MTADSISKQIKTTEVVYRTDLYPRLNHDPATVQKYAEDLSVMPPIEVNQNNELIDGWHRWTAHKKNEVDVIDVIVTQTKSDAEFLELAIVRNAIHGIQLNNKDKKNMAQNIYLATSNEDRADKKKRLAEILSVTAQSINGWLRDIDKKAKKDRDEKIFELWMQCHSQQVIADSTNVTKETVSAVCQKKKDISKSDKSLANHENDFEPPIYNIWRQQSKSNEVGHFGNTEQRWVDNLLYLHTDPFDIVVDPFAGGGSTIDVCKKRFRRYYVSDRKPIVEREDEIRLHDIADGLPKLPRWKDVKLVYLDPPYWKQAEDQYSSDPEDLANMSLEDFNKNLSGLIKSFARKMSAGSHIALIIQPTQWKSEDKQFTDHIGDMLRAIKLPVDMRYSAPYSTQQYTPQMVNWAKENKKCLVLTREIIVWKVQ